jgi:hypothetical protein
LVVMTIGATVLEVVAVASLAVLALCAVSVVRWGWRLLRENEEPVAGGSMRTQMVRGSGDEKSGEPS